MSLRIRKPDLVRHVSRKFDSKTCSAKNIHKSSEFIFIETNEDFFCLTWSFNFHMRWLVLVVSLLSCD